MSENNKFRKCKNGFILRTKKIWFQEKVAVAYQLARSLEGQLVIIKFEVAVYCLKPIKKERRKALNYFAKQLNDINRHHAHRSMNGNQTFKQLKTFL